MTVEFWGASDLFQNIYISLLKFKKNKESSFLLHSLDIEAGLRWYLNPSGKYFGTGPHSTAETKAGREWIHKHTRELSETVCLSASSFVLIQHRLSRL